MDSVSYNDKEINYLVFISKFVRNPFFCLYCKVALDDGFGILFFSQILFFITEMWFLSLVSMHEGVFTNDYLSEDFFGILFCDYCKVELDDGLLFYCSFFLIQFLYNRNVISFSNFHAAILTFLIYQTARRSAEATKRIFQHFDFEIPVAFGVHQKLIGSH